MAHAERLEAMTQHTTPQQAQIFRAWSAAQGDTLEESHSQLKEIDYDLRTLPENSVMSIPEFRAPNYHVMPHDWIRHVSGMVFVGSYPGTSPTFVDRDSEKFNRLKVQWLKEAGHKSKVRDKVLAMPYLSTIAMGRRAVPLIMHELKVAPRWWFTALEAITEENPVPESHRGDIAQMAKDWLGWWESRNSSWANFG
jgi:hypothetical protein